MSDFHTYITFRVNEWTITVALLAHLPESQMAVGTGFGQVFRGLGQVGGVAISSAVFQTMLEKELRKRIVGRDDAEEVSHPSCLYTSI